MKTGQRPLRSLPYCFALLHEKSRPPEGERRYTKLSDFIQTTKFRKYPFKVCKFRKPSTLLG
jgi:hypothetical protein